MKPRHAVALALVGWYLMVPPSKNANQIDPSVPLPKWVVLRAFDTADACNEAQDQLRYRVSRLNLQFPSRRQHRKQPNSRSASPATIRASGENETSHASSRRGASLHRPHPRRPALVHLPVEAYAHSPPSLQTLRNPIHDAQSVPAPAPAPQPHRARVTYEARN